MHQGLRLPHAPTSRRGLRKAAAVALGKIGYKNAWTAISAAPKTSEDWEYAAALYRLGHRDALDAVTAALHSHYADVRIAALRDLLEFADNQALPALLDHASPQPANPTAAKVSANESIAFRLLIADGLARFSGPEAQTAVIKMMEDHRHEYDVGAAFSDRQRMCYQRPGWWRFHVC